MAKKNRRGSRTTRKRNVDGLTETTTTTTTVKREGAQETVRTEKRTKPAYGTISKKLQNKLPQSARATLALLLEILILAIAAFVNMIAAFMVIFGFYPPLAQAALGAINIDPTQPPLMVMGLALGTLLMITLLLTVIIVVFSVWMWKVVIRRMVHIRYFFLPEKAVKTDEKTYTD